MGYLRAGYYIDEIDTHLRKVVGADVLEKYYEQNLPYKVDELPTSIDISSINPLLKVAWNIINRGQPTRASISLSEYILNAHLGEGQVHVNYKNPTVDLEFDWELFKNIEPEHLRLLLTNFSTLTEDKVALKLGEGCLTLYKILRDLQSAAKVQQLVLLLYLIYNPEEKLEIKVQGVNEDLALIVVENLNELFYHLNSLASKEESNLGIITQSDKRKALHINYNSQDNHGFSISYLSSEELKETEESQYFQKVLTDRRISYKSLGQLHEKEADEKYEQYFEFSTKEQEQALRYFLQNIFRKSRFRAGQKPIIDRALQGKDVIGLLPTGGGKSLTYQLCGLLHPGISVVIEPINSLMKDQFDGLKENGITNAVFINSFNSQEEREENLNNLLQSRYQFVYISPERLQIQKFRTYLEDCADYGIYYSYAVIDEAHCVSEWGHDFRHTYLNLAQNLKRFCKVKKDELVFFGLTATASFDVLADVQRELEMAEDAIVTLPADAIDRKELNFNIVKFESELDEVTVENFFGREQAIGREKHVAIKSLLNNIPQELNKLSNKTSILELGNNFYRKNAEGDYENSGVIFCPTKSDKLLNGVLSLKDTLKKAAPYLDIGTFFGGGDEDSVRNKRVEEEASTSVDNQDEFMKNKKNLMIATKAFGMGLDKPNIRFTYHYSFPDSVESFYQEAGRAGRDGKTALCNILYHKEDIRTNYDFYQNSFKGISREKEIIDELLTEVQYEEGFYASIINRRAKEEFSEVGKVSFWNNRYLYVFGQYHEDPACRINIAAIDLLRGLRTYDNFRKNIDAEKAKIISDRIIEIVKEEAGEQDYLEWIQTKSTHGIKTLLDDNNKDEHALLIGFNNNTVNELSEYLLEDNSQMEPRVIRAAYSFCGSSEEFIDNLRLRYRQHTGYQSHLEINREQILEIKKKYFQIRNSSDTLRAIYRLMIAGVVDDYVIDYAVRMVKIKFKGKSEEEYFENLSLYLKRYLGNESTEKWMTIARNEEYESPLQKVLFTLIKFIDQEITEKRKRAIDYMQQLCEIGHEQGDKVFRENIVYYFTSKYARVNYLPKDTDGGRIESAEVVKKYLDYINNPPDELGGEINNAKHLRGACENLRITMTRDNASIDLLTAYSYFALESQQSEDFEGAMERPLIKQAIKLYKKGFKDLQKKESWPSILELLEIFNTKALDINSTISPVLEPLTNEILIYRTRNRLEQFLNQIIK